MSWIAVGHFTHFAFTAVNFTHYVKTKPDSGFTVKSQTLITVRGLRARIRVRAFYLPPRRLGGLVWTCAKARPEVDVVAHVVPVFFLPPQVAAAKGHARTREPREEARDEGDESYACELSLTLVTLPPTPTQHSQHSDRLTHRPT